ncbi:MAG TPA: folylpolyglutamate synthase/dihydrofolate synthase family protein [Candidatus Nanoarchaeia archaeon]|nr:folylpolyglutamate synthase/dihydrofolate synthase family protein [Candidatus Nanoarchaeia archaeon]
MQKILDYLYGLNQFGVKLRLEEMEKLVKALDNPQDKFKSVHVAGTNGKGSTCAFLASILEQAGFKVGLNTSPHLVRFNERIKINGKNISNQKLGELTTVIKEKVENNQISTTFFEFTTALAFLYFAQEKVDYAVVEVGMGGRLDATNVLLPEVSIITSIDLDHTGNLGETKELIAKEKAGIIKEGKLVITAETDPEIITLFQEICRERKTSLLVLDEVLKIEKIKSNLKSQTFRMSGIISETFRIKLLGDYQLRNASLAVLIASQLGIPLDKIKLGLKKAVWSGRLEIIRKDPLVIVDGSHNPQGFNTLKSFLDKNILNKDDPKKIILVLGVAKDKKWEEMLPLIVPLAEQVMVTEGNFKPTPVEILAEETLKSHPATINESNNKVKIIKKSWEAVQEALKLAEKEDLVLIAGSLYLAGDVLKYKSKIRNYYK